MFSEGGDDRLFFGKEVFRFCVFSVGLDFTKCCPALVFSGVMDLEVL